MSREAIEQAARLGVVVDIQPAWLYLDTPTLPAQFGYDRLRYFQPLKSLFAAGVDGRRRLGPHAEDRLAPVDQPLQPVPGHVGRRSPAEAQGYEGRLHPEEALTREQAIRFYTINNARLLFLEDQDRLARGGQAGRLHRRRPRPADLPRGRDPRDAQVLSTYLDGKRIFDRKK